MSHSRREQTYRDLRDSRADQDDRDREANEIIREIADRDDWDETTVRVVIPTAEIVAEHSAPPFPEFARRRTDAEVYTMDDYRRGLEVTRTDLPAMPDREPSWPQVLRMGLVDALKEVL